ncbi:MAG: methylmalonyl-CoA mutase, partial [Acidobacteria bacterium]|nr:methylmalonyl-CoA mutase [Acidobacteriota bacterium]
DPLGGSYYVEWLTNTIETESRKYLDRIEKMGGMLRAIETGFVQKEIQESAFRYQRAVESGQQVVVGVNRFQQSGESGYPVLRVDPALEAEQVARLRQLRAGRDAARVEATLRRLEQAATGTENLMTAILAAVEAYATVGEISNALRSVFGEYNEAVVI